MRIIMVYKSPLFSTLQFLCDLHKSIISFKSNYFFKPFWPNPEVYSELCQMSKMECFAKIVYSFQSLTIFSKLSILDVWQGSGLWNYFAVLLREELKLKIQMAYEGFINSENMKSFMKLLFRKKQFKLTKSAFYFLGTFFVNQ